MVTVGAVDARSEDVFPWCFGKAKDSREGRILVVVVVLVAVVFSSVEEIFVVVDEDKDKGQIQKKSKVSRKGDCD